ncbi:hypothetical protein [Synechococcus sp. UW179A]|uniref:hypothetical protein n=1 Tax=Synechococcus sp. UW179A TaxID=2575510 RepID=UPI0010BE66C8|nr:hypothetical protein [Synechococcus sp. UW179A]
MRLCRVSVAIPHYFKEGSQEIGYGSTRAGTRLARQVALGRCLGSVLALGRQPQDLILNHAQQALEVTSVRHDSTTRLMGVVVDVHIFVTGRTYLHDICEHFASRITMHHLDLKDPKQLPLAASDWLCRQSDHDADIHFYFEDDLVIHDPRFVDKQVWFTERTQHQFVLMPHRLEPCVHEAPMQICVDGPIKIEEQFEPVWSKQEQESARGSYWDGRSVGFTEASNPHSGCFCLSEPQRQHWLARKLTPTEFVGPLETAATGTVWQHFPVLKPMWADRDFLCLEHGHPSFLASLGQMPVRRQDSPAQDLS